MFFKPEYILILLLTILIDYFAGILIEKEQMPIKKKRFLFLSLMANIGILGVFKYFNFINYNITGLMTLFKVEENPIPNLSIFLPIGLSFHTFQAMSYTIEVYKGRQKAEKHLGFYALYVMFYPQLVAGPIERPQNILPQFREKKSFIFENALIGLNFICYGLFKKVVVADRLADYVNQVYGDIDNANTITVLITLLFFSIQIYCDFSGYSDMARGIAKFMGYDLMRNFNRPYLSQSIAEFWQRWHISLSSWFRDYVYIPLGGNQVNRTKQFRNISLVFLASGLWHGPNWTFILWGGLHGFYLIFGEWTKSFRQKALQLFGIKQKTRFIGFLNQIIVFSIVSFTWIFFRAENFEKAETVLSKLWAFDFTWQLSVICTPKGPFNLIVSFLTLFLLWMSYLLPQDLIFKNYKTNFFFLLSVIILIIILGKDGNTEFIYFQF